MDKCINTFVLRYILMEKNPNVILTEISINLNIMIFEWQSDTFLFLGSACTCSGFCLYININSCVSIITNRNDMRQMLMSGYQPIT